MANNTRTVIIVKQGGALLREYELSPGTYVLGRDPACGIRVQSTLIADRHVQLTYDGKQVEVTDLGSPTGTVVAGQRLQQPTRVADAGLIRLGDVTVEIQQPPAAPPLGPADQPSVTRLSASTAAAVPPVRRTKSREREYEVTGEVARGGMGAVLRATDLNIKRTVAMKVVLASQADNEQLLQRFTQEAELTGQLEHPNIVPVHDLSFDEQGHAFYTMKLVKGVTLHAVLEQIKSGDAATVARY